MKSASAPLTVAHIITKLAVGGAQESVVVTCTGLPSSDFEQLIVSGTEVDSEGSLWADSRLRGTRVFQVPSLVRAVRPLRDVRAVVVLTRLLRELRPDIVHTHSSKAGIVGRVAARLARIPTVVHSVHGWSFTDDMSSPVRRLVIVAERLTAKLTDVLIIESSTDLTKGLSNGIGRAGQYALIRNGIPLERFAAVDRARARLEILPTLGIPQSAWVVGTVGRLADQKDPLLMVDAFALVRRSVPDAHFVWVGDGPLRAVTEERVRALGMADSFHLLGVRHDVASVLGAFDAFALSSRWEGLPRTITEAMAVGLPVVATRVDGSAEAIEDGTSGLLVNPGSSSDLAGSLSRLRLEPDLAARLSSAAVVRSKLFARELMLDELAQLYHRLTRSVRRV